MQHSRKWLTVIGPLVLALALTAACGSDDSEKSSDDSGKFPASEYPDSTFKGLKGTVTYYDTGGGAGTEALAKTIDKDFTELTGVNVVSDFNATMTKFNAAMEAGQGQWDLVMFSTGGDAITAADQGYLDTLDSSKIPLDQIDDPTTTDQYFSAFRFGIVLTWNTETFSGDSAPKTMTDLYDTERFPGKRCLFQYPQFGGVLESALLADGVAPEQLYPLDVDRALRKLDTIKKDIVWWGSGDEAVQFLTSGECDLGIAWTGRVFDAVTKDGAPLDFSWDKALYASGYYGIPKNAPNKDAATAYLAHFIKNKQAQEAFLSLFPYPTPIKGLQIPAEVDKWVPLGDNIANAISEDEQWYSQNIGDLNKTFTDWVGK